MGTLTNKCIKHHTQLEHIPDSFGKSIEEEIRIATANKQPIEGSAQMVYTPLKDGVLPQFDIRTDKQELALDALDKVSKSEFLHKDEMPSKDEKNENTENDNNDNSQLDF